LVNRSPGTAFSLEDPGSIIGTAVDEVVVMLSGILRIFEKFQEIEAVI
jgi:hypothetical protein